MTSHPSNPLPANPLSDTDEAALALQAAAFRRLVSHLQNRTDVQNIDMMNLAGFCRNCLSGWYQDAANAQGMTLDKDGAREIIYGMAYSDWKEQFQTEANADQKAAFEKQHDANHSA